ncbi:HAD family hydrolase [Candidatus Daviesbacteria bacterium]|nr:HAD family hydrolase [Candidatus Daviesbacteria bacterium]
MKNVHMSSLKIPLFDIDWTLLRGEEINKKAHRDAYNFALHSIYNLPSHVSQRDYFSEGKIDSQVLMEIAKLHGVTEDEAKTKVHTALSTMAKYFIKHAGEGHYEPMPGVVNLLSDLKSKGIPLGLLTGNVAEIGREKLRRAGIADYFAFGAFGSMAFKRVDLIQIAKEKASKVLGQDISIHRFVIVGDSPLDIACARDGGIPVIAVGAGHYKSHELSHADLVVDSLEEQGKIIKFLKLA